MAQADPPSRVARVGYLSGPVTFSPGGEDDWVAISLNRPLVTGDRVWADRGARAELQTGAAAIRLGEFTSVTLLNLDDRVAQFELAQGAMSIRVRRLDPGEVLEIDTPNVAFVISRPGEYRIGVDADGDSTWVHTRTGQAVVHGENGTYAVAAGRAYRFFGTDLRDYENLPPPASDEFDRWARDRDRGYEGSVSARYVSRDVIGYRDLDTHGTWRSVPEYGQVWMPTRVSADWAPYRDGHWSWIEPWGWTWVDDAPWGFAVSHYGRWAHFSGGWGWIPGPVRSRAVYAPALVAFIGGANFQVAISSGNVGAVGWFPLGPREVYRPAYPVSRQYFTNVNVTNTVINVTNVTNVYSDRDVSRVAFVNRQVAGAVVTVPTTAFVQSQPVARVALRVPREVFANARVTAIAEFAPTQASLHGNASRGAKPPAQALERRVVARSKPPAGLVGFASRQRALEANPGRPVDAAALSALRTEKPRKEPRVEIVAPASNAKPVAPPPRPATTKPGRGGGERAEQASAAPGKKPQREEPASEKPQAEKQQAEKQQAEKQQAEKPKREPPGPAAMPQRVPKAPVASPPAAQPPDRRQGAGVPKPGDDRKAKDDKPARGEKPGKDEDTGKDDEPGKDDEGRKGKKQK